MKRGSALLNRIFAVVVIVTLICSMLPKATVVQAAAPEASPASSLPDPAHTQYGSGWTDTPPTTGQAQLPPEQAAAPVVPEDLLQRARVRLSVDPAIYIPGTPLELTWKMEGVKKHTGAVSLVISLPEGIHPSDKELAALVSNDGKLTIAAPDDRQDTLTLSVDERAQFPLYIGAEVVAEGELEPVNGDAVYLGTSGGQARMGLNASLSGFQNRVQLRVPSAALSEDLLFDLRPPSPHKQPAYSLSTEPVEIIAVGKSSKKNVTQFKTPLTLEWHYEDAKLRKGWAEADLQLFYFNEEAEEWFPLETVVDAENNVLRAQTDHLTVFDYKATSWQGYVPPAVDSFQVSDFTGAGTYAIDLWTPPGPAGLQPALSLSYNSQVIDEGTAFTQASWVGSGWSLDTGAIVRNMHGTNDDTTDDTFSISAGGVSGLLLQINTTDYNTADQSFIKVTKIGTVWTAYGKDGTVYEFAERAMTHTTDGCEPAANLNLAWRWSLTSVTDAHGNEITYTYTQETKSATCANVIAVYPATVTYANNHYRVQFVTETRGDYQTAWTQDASRVLFGKKRLDKILIQNDQNGTWTTVRQYNLTYSADTTNQIMPRFKWRNTAFTSTLTELQELDGEDELSSNKLPAMQFTYTDDLHLTAVNNGQGGEVTLTYSMGYYYDDVNDEERSIIVNVGQGGWECTTTSMSPWTGITNPAKVRCDPSTTPQSLQVGEDPTGSAAHRTLPDYMVKPGARFNLQLEASPIVGSSTLETSVTDPTKSGDNENNFFVVTLSSRVYNQGQAYMAADFNPNTTRLRVECSDCRVRNFTLQMMHTYYQVNTRTVSDQVTGQATTYTYTWDNMTLNTALVSEAIATHGVSAKYYYPPLTDLRGRSMVQRVNSQGLADVTWFYQGDALKGRAYRQLQMQRSYYDALGSLNATNWTKSATGTFTAENIVSTDFDLSVKAVSSTATWAVSYARAGFTLADGEGSSNTAVAHFRLSGTNGQAEVGLTSANNQYFGLVVKPEGGQLVARLRTNTGAGLVDSSEPLLAAGEFQRDRWYVAMLMVDNDDGFRVKLWQLDRPERYGEATMGGFAPESWKFRERVNTGTLWLDAYFEGVVYNETETLYGQTTQYDTLSNTIPNIVGATLLTYKDLAVRWVYPQSQTTRVYDGDADWHGTRVSYEYQVDGEGRPLEYGNVKTATYAAREPGGTGWVDHHAVHTQYNLIDTINPVRYRVDLPARQVTAAAGCAYPCTAPTASVLSETLYFYDGSTAYTTPASGSGQLTMQRARVQNTAQDPNYSQVVYSYTETDEDGGNFGNLVSLTSYEDYFDADSAIPVEGGRTTLYTYDQTYHAYQTEVTDPLGHKVVTTFDDALGLPTSVKDANEVTTRATYDGFGRMLTICAPGDLDGLPCLRDETDLENPRYPTLEAIYSDYATGAPYHVTLRQKLDDDHEPMTTARFYGGLGQVIQTQSLGAKVKTVEGVQIKNIVVDTFYDEWGRVVGVTKPYPIPVTITPIFQTQSATNPKTVTSYDLLGRVVRVEEPNTTAVETTYGELQVTQTDALEHATVTDYDVWGQVKKVTPPEGPALEYTYDTLGRLTKVIKGGQTQQSTTITYDLGGRKTSMTDPDMGPWSYAYDALGQLTTQTDARGCQTSLTYDELGRLTAKSYVDDDCPETAPVHYYYDSDQVSVLGHSSYLTETYPIGRKIAMVDGSGATFWKYDQRGNKLEETKVVYRDDTIPHQEAESFVTAWSYNSADLPVTMTYPGAIVEEVSLSYNDQGLLESVDSANFTYVKDTLYDEAGRVTEMQLGQNGDQPILTRSYAYSSWNDLIQGGRLSTLKTNSLQNLSYSYDANGNVTGITNNGEASVYTYDLLDRLKSVTIDDEAAEGFTYDSFGRMSSKSKGSEAAKTLGYTDTNKPHAVRDYGDNSYGYDANGNQTTRTIVDGSATQTYTLTYDAENRLVEVAIPEEGQGLRAPEATPTHELIPTETPTEEPTPEATPTEEPTQEPTQEPTEEPTQEPTSTEVPTETPASEVTGTPGLPEAGSDSTPDAGQLEQVTAEPTATLTAAATEEPTPTEESLPTPEPTAAPTEEPTLPVPPAATEEPLATEEPTLTPDATETALPTETTEPEEPASGPMSLLASAVDAHYLYDGDGMLVKSQIDGVVTYYAGRHYHKKVDGQDVTVQKFYTAGSSQVAVRTITNGQDTLTWILSDHLGSASVTANADGTFKSETKYTAFGEVRSPSGTSDTPYLYTGQLSQMEEIGLYYFVARFYDPATAHFASADTLVPEPGKALAYNRFAYALYNPLRYIDPDGHTSVACTGGVDSPGCVNNPTVTQILQNRPKQPVAPQQKLVSPSTIWPFISNSTQLDVGYIPIRIVPNGNLSSRAEESYTGFSTSGETVVPVIKSVGVRAANGISVLEEILHLTYWSINGQWTNTGIMSSFYVEPSANGLDITGVRIDNTSIDVVAITKVDLRIGSGGEWQSIYIGPDISEELSYGEASPGTFSLVEVTSPSIPSGKSFTVAIHVRTSGGSIAYSGRVEKTWQYNPWHYTDRCYR